MASLDELRQLLQKDSNGVNLYDHLTEVMLKVLLEKPADAYEAFEHISAGVKVASVKSSDPAAAAALLKAQHAHQAAWASSSAALLRAPDEKPEDCATYPDVVEESNLLEWAGVSFGRETVYLLHLSLKKLAESLPSAYGQVRFWGQVNHARGRYYVAEARTYEDGEFDAFTEEGMGGVNKYTYWVTQEFAQPWVKLPNVNQKQMVRARLVKKILTGDLDADVFVYPPFEGKEKHFLRCQIARITSSACVSPSGFFALDEDSETPTIKAAEDEALAEAFPKPAEELKASDAWVHHEMEVNTLGRVQPMPERVGDDGEPIVDENAPEQVSPLRSLADDTEGSWAFRACPGAAGAGGVGNGSGGVAIARSLVWPGAVAVYSGRKFINVYVGDAVKYAPNTYTPPLPGKVQREWAPVEEEPALIESADVLSDPTPPAAAEEES